ncbi:MAG: MaoC family dehydratase N-terminal domain-containing protein [Acidimicrobiia bacterium]
MAEEPAGQERQGYEMVVERGKIREFALATMTHNPEYLDDPVAVSPPTFLQTAAFWAPEGATSPSGMLDMNLARVLHGGQEFVFFGPPPRAGTKLTTESRVDKVYEKEGRRGGTMKFAETVTSFFDESGNLVAESRATIIETGKAPTEEV